MSVTAIGIMSAMPQEADSILANIKDQVVTQLGIRQFVTGVFEGARVVFVLAGVGKASAAATTALLISNFPVREIIFTGVAGGGGCTSIGDIVIGDSYLQHDLDLRPVFPQFHIFSLNTQLVYADSDLVQRMKTAAERFLKRGISFPELGILNPKVHTGGIASGDQFVGNAADHKKIAESTEGLFLEGFLAIEMEGAPFAQVCKELDVSCVVVRSISDKANHDAAVNFQDFMEVASNYSLGVLQEYFRSPLSP